MRGRGREGLLSKKGNVVADSITWTIVIVVFVFACIFGIYIARAINTDLQSDNSLTPDNKAKLDSLVGRLPTFTDGAVLFVVVGLWIAVIVASVLVDAHPMFFVITLIVAILMLLLGMAISNVWDDMSSDPELNPVVSDVPITNFILSNFAIYIMVIVFTIGVVLYAKRQS